MPHFFDPNDLTDEQKARWDWAVAEYNRVQAQNIDRDIAAMTEDQKASTLEAIGVDPSDTDSLKAHMTALRAIMVGGAGHPKSALFARLLNGSAALAEPPPTAYSYPWYEVVEDPGPFAVQIGPAGRARSVFGRATSADERQIYMAINQCAWKVISLNEAAAELLAAEDELKSTNAGGDGEGYAWTPSLLGRALEAYAQGPEFIVQFGRWDHYRLALGRHAGACQRKHLMNTIKEMETRTVTGLQHCHSVLDVNWFFIRPVIGEVRVKAEHPRVQHERQKVSPLSNSLSKLLVKPDLGALNKRIAEYEADPTAMDHVAVEHDVWMLEKMFINAPFTAEQVQRLNEHQTGTGKAMAVHPFTCANRGDGQHGTHGGDTGVLIATPAGWVCPDCDYTQDWAHASMAAAPTSDFESSSAIKALFAEDKRTRLEARLLAYRSLAASGGRGASTMVDSLLLRAKELM